MNESLKKTYRKIIRGIMIAVAVLLFTVALIIPVANNGVALGLERELKALPLPADARLVESISLAGKVSGNGNGMQYYAALLLESDLSQDTLQSHYSAYADGRTDYAIVLPQNSQQLPAMDQPKSFHTTLDPDKTYYAVYAYGHAPAGWGFWLELDLRGH